MQKEVKVVNIADFDNRINKRREKTNFTFHFPGRFMLSQITNNISIRRFLQLTRREQLKSSTETKDYPSRFNIQLSQDGTRAGLKIAQHKTEKQRNTIQ